MEAVLFAVVCAAVVVAVLAWRRSGRKPHPPFAPPPPETAAQQVQRLDWQLKAVSQTGVRFRKSRIMGKGEYDLFRAALNVTGQPMPSGQYPYYVFPQVSLGQIIRTDPATGREADEAYRSINSKRCDLLIADWQGNPIVVLEYQGAGHDIGGTAGRRDNIKRTALERAGMRYVEIGYGTPPAEMQRIIRELMAPAMAGR